MEMTDFEKNQSRLQEIINNPQKAIALQSGISTAATCRILKMMRLMLGSPNFYDQIELSQEILNLLDYIQKNDYFLFLVLMNQLDLIFEIFYKEFFLREFEYIKDLQNEKKKNERRYHQNLELLQKKMSESHKKNEESPNESYRLNAKTISVHLDMFNYFFLNYLEITREFHTKQIETYEEDYNGRVNLIERAIEIIEENHILPEHEPNPIVIFLENYKSARNSVEEIKTINNDGSIDYQKLEEKHQKWATLKLKYSQSFKEILQQYETVSGISQILKEVDEHDLKFQSILVKNENEYHEKISKIMPGLESSISLIKKDISDGMMALKKELNLLNTKNFSEEERKELHAFIDHLEKSEQLIQKIKNPLEIQNAIQKVLTDIENFEKNHSMSFLKSGVIQKLEQFKSILIQINNGIHIKELTLNYSNPLENQKNSSRKNENNIILPEIIHDEKIQKNIQKTKDFQKEIKNVVENNGEKEEEKEGVIDEEKKSLLHESIESLIIQLNKIKKESDFDEDNFVSSLIKSHRALKKDFSQEKLERVIEILEDLTNNLEDLTNNLEDFEEIQQDINNVRYELEAFKDQLNNISTLKM